MSEETEPKADLSLLTDAELSVLSAIMSKATREPVEMPTQEEIESLGVSLQDESGTAQT